MKNDRKPIYFKDQTHRVVSVPNGLWQLEGNSGNKATREASPWFKRGAPSDLDTILKSI